MKRKKKPEAVGAILDGLARKSPLGRQLEHARIWERWPELVGPHLGLHGRPVVVKDNVLHIEVESSVWMHKFAYRKWDIVQRINRMARKELVSDIFIALNSDETMPGSQDEG
jgi:predicted nucleic acid-binding Zn ribbon protein